MTPGIHESKVFDDQVPPGTTLKTTVKNCTGEKIFVELTQIKELGRGAFGAVNKMKLIQLRPRSSETQLVAVKKPSQEAEGLDLIERDLLLGLNHKVRNTYGQVENSSL